MTFTGCMDREAVNEVLYIAPHSPLLDLYREIKGDFSVRFFFSLSMIALLCSCRVGIRDGCGWGSGGLFE